MSTPNDKRSPDEGAREESAGETVGAEQGAFPETGQEEANHTADDGEQDDPAQINAALKDQLLRTLADMENLRNRSRREQEDALKYAYQKGVVIVASAGNDSGLVIYPAAYDNYVLAVAATDYNDTRTPWSNSGSQIDVAAPGDRIIGCYPVWALPGGTLPYVFGFGTSASAAYTSGLAALIVSIKPWLTPDEVLDIIRFSSDDVNGAEFPGIDEFIGHGRINMEKALVPIKIK